RCTQNPTMGEEWRRGWHPESIAVKRNSASVLVVGAGPAGLECARALGQRGYEVTLVEGRREPGGRVALESRLPGLSEWRRVIDWRLIQIDRLLNVTLYPESPMTPDEVLEAGFRHVIVATGARWRRDGVGRSLWNPLPGNDLPQVFTPDDLLAGRLPSGRVVVFDDDHYYMGGVLAEMLAHRGCKVTLLTPASLVSYWTQYTLEQERIQQRLMALGVQLLTQRLPDAILPDAVRISHAVSGESVALPCDAVVLVTDRLPDDALYLALKPALAEGRLKSLGVIGDAEAPNIIARAVFSGHRAAREFDEMPLEGTPFRVEYPALE
nr:FAD-dependent oxidoreductase [Anaerolineae bacterium]